VAELCADEREDEEEDEKEADDDDDDPLVLAFKTASSSAFNDTLLLCRTSSAAALRSRFWSRDSDLAIVSTRGSSGWARVGPKPPASLARAEGLTAETALADLLLLLLLLILLLLVVTLEDSRMLSMSMKGDIE